MSAKLALFMPFMQSATVAAASYFMSPTGNDSYSGTTLSAPWKTMHRLMSAQGSLRPGDVVYFRGGNYLINDSSPNTVIQFTADGTASNPITYKQYGSEVPVVVYDRRATVGRQNIFVLGDHVTLEGLTFRQTEESRCLALADSCTVRKGTAADGFAEYYAKRVGAMRLMGKSNTVRKCVFDNFSAGEVGTNLEDALVKDCTFRGAANHIIYAAGSYGTIRNNYFDGSRMMPDGSRRGINIQYATSHHNKIYGNVFLNNAGGAVICSGRVAHNEVFNNILINCGDERGGEAVSTWTEDGPVGPGNRFYNNTVIGRTYGNIFDGKMAEFLKLDIRDNIFYPTPARKTGLAGRSYPNIQNNIFFNVSDAVPPGNRSGNPLLVNPLGGTAASAMLQRGSPAIDTGSSSLCPTTDFVGIARPNGSKCDIGAYEYPSVHRGPARPTGLGVR